MALSFYNSAVFIDQSPLFEPVTFDLQTGLHAIVGPSGSGKSSLLLAAVRLLDPGGNLSLKGRVTLDNQSFESFDPLSYRRQVTLVTQHPVMFFGSIADNICIGALDHHLFKESQKHDFALQQLKKVGLYATLKHRLNESASLLSLGQKQRVAFARSLAINPRYLLLDEPTSSLDPHSTSAIEELLLELKLKMGIILVSHNQNQVEKLADNSSHINPIHDRNPPVRHTQNLAIVSRFKNLFTARHKPIAKEL